MDGIDGNIQDTVDRIGMMLGDSIVRTKQIARGLVPVKLEEQGFSAAIAAIVDAAGRSHNIKIDFHSSPEIVFKEKDRALQLYRIVQEALNNAIKHSGADHIVVRLGCEGEPPVIVAEVSDNGMGLDTHRSHEGMGLRIMKYRAEKAEAELDIEKLRPGTRVVCRIRSGGEKVHDTTDDFSCS